MSFFICYDPLNSKLKEFIAQENFSFNNFF